MRKTNGPVNTWNAVSMAALTIILARSTACLGKGQLLAPPEERPSILQQRLNLLGDALDELLCALVGVFGRLGEEGLEPEAIDLAEPRIDEEGDTSPGQCAIGVGGGREEVGRVRVGEKLRDDGRLGEDLAVVGQGRNKAARVDLEVLGGTRGAEVDDLLLERDAKFGQSDVGTMSP